MLHNAFIPPMDKDFVALLALTVAAFSFVLSIWNAHTTRALHRDNQLQKALADIQTVANQINEALVKYEVDGPYQANLGLNGDKEARGRIVTLILHLNLLRISHTNRNVLGKQRLMDAESWATRVVKPWIASDPIFQKTYERWITDADGGAAYTKWLEALIPLSEVMGSNSQSSSRQNAK